MRKMAAVVLGALALSGCADLPVAGRIGNTPFKGTIHRTTLTEGTISVDSAKGAHCGGEYTANTTVSGIANLRCDNGRFVFVRFRSVHQGQGFGYGWTDHREFVTLVYGMPEDEASVYLKTHGNKGEGGDGAGDDDDEKVGVFGGTGFFINDRGDVLTNNHVAGHCSSLTARLPDGQTVPGKGIYYDVTNDLAIVRLDVKPTAMATFAEDTYRQGDAATAYGYPLPGALTTDGVLTTGTVSAMAGLNDDSRFIQMSTPVQPGNSGGPLADASAHVVGVVTQQLGISALKGGLLPQNVNFAVKETVVKTFLHAHTVPFQQSPPTSTPLSPSEVGAILKSMVVAITCTRTKSP